MKNRNNILVILLVGLALVLSGCSSDTGAKQSGIFGIGTGSSSNSGSGSGIDLSFAQNNPPSKMIKGAPATFAFVFTNNQKHDVTDLKLRTKGFERSYISGLNKDYNLGLIPKATLSAGPGIYTGLVVSGVTVDGFTNNFNFNPSFEYCYSAKTAYREQVCIPSKQNQCDIQVDNSVESNGPVRVNVDRINSIGDEVNIQFSLSNSGSGKVVNTCFKTDDYSNDYKAEVKLGTATGKCTANSGYKLNNGVSNFYCTFPRSSDSAYASQITVNLDYKYDQEIQKQIVVEDLTVN